MNKVLELGIPKGASKMQIKEIEQAIKIAKEKGIQVNVRVVD